MKKESIVQYFDQGIHFDGRGLQQMREVTVETGVTKSAEGSARVSIGDTEVIAGVKMAVETPYPDTPEDGNLAVNVELLPLSSPDFEPGPPGILATEIARVVDRGIRESNLLDRKKLCIEQGEKVWSVMIDVCSINDAGNLFDASALAAIAALKDARFPEYDGTQIDYMKRTDTPLPLNKIPTSITVYKIGDHLVVDPDQAEEQFIEARLTCASIDEHTIVAFQKGGDAPLSSEELLKMVDIALATSQHVRTSLNG